MMVIELICGCCATVDNEDYADLVQYRWGAVHNTSGGVYARITNRQNRKLMHRLVMERKIGGDIPETMIVDHINGDTLDNRCDNLRIVTPSQSLMNTKKRGGTTSKYKGVHWNVGMRKWQARIHLNSKSKHLGYFDTEEEAYEAREEIAKALHGEYFYDGISIRK